LIARDLDPGNNPLVITCEVEESEGGVTLHLSGELWDPRDADALVIAVEPHFINPAGRVVLDLDELDLLGLVGLGILLTLQGQARLRGMSFEMAGGSDEVRSQLAKVGLASG
jgi:anti-anti-sigma factor